MPIAARPLASAAGAASVGCGTWLWASFGCRLTCGPVLSNYTRSGASATQRTFAPSIWPDRSWTASWRSQGLFASQAGLRRLLGQLQRWGAYPAVASQEEAVYLVGAIFLVFFSFYFWGVVLGRSAAI